MPLSLPPFTPCAGRDPAAGRAPAPRPAPRHRTRPGPRNRPRWIALALALALPACVSGGPAGAQGQGPGQGQGQLTSVAADPGPTYADLVDLALAARLVGVVTVEQSIALEPERAPGLAAGEARLYLETRLVRLVETAGAPVSLTVIRRPGMAPAWGVSLGEIVDQSARPPAPETLAWYRLACGLPQTLPGDAFLQRDAASQAAARADYAFVLEALGPCARRLPARAAG